MLSLFGKVNGNSLTQHKKPSPNLVKPRGYGNLDETAEQEPSAEGFQSFMVRPVWSGVGTV